MAENFKNRYGPWALVVGSAEGTGVCYAERLAEQGLNVFLVDLRSDLLEQQAWDLQHNYGIKTLTYCCDLRDTVQVSNLIEELNDIEIGMLVYNASYSKTGYWNNVPLDEKVATININCITPTMLINHVTKPMTRRKRGGIIIMSAMAGMQGCAMQATYTGSKAYSRVFGEALWYEMKEHSVDVLTLVTPMVRTPSFKRHITNPPTNWLMPILEPARVVDEVLSKLGKQPILVASRRWRFLNFVMQRLMPRKALIESSSETMIGLFPDEKSS